MNLALLLLFACPKTNSVVIDWQDTPRLPSPRAGSYASLPAKPLDPGVASLVNGRRWDSVLSGAASGLALRLVSGEGSLTVPEVREAALQAGWLYPIQGAQVWVAKRGGPPPSAVGEWLQQTPATTPIGLVRARSTLEDVWVGLRSNPRAKLDGIPRQLPVGGTLQLPELKGASLTLSDPYGNLEEASLDTAWSHLLDVEGEWLFEVRDAQGVVALFTVYVGVVPPDLHLLVPSRVPPTWTEADERTADTLARVRDAYGLSPFRTDPIMAAAAQTAAENPATTTADLAPTVGMDPSELWRWECHAPTVEACIDAILWDVRSRPGWLTPSALYGRDVRLTNLGVQIVLLVGAQ
jgi:hypothetical protein